MFLPVGRADTGVFDGGATVNHHIVAHINSNVGDRPGAGIGAGKENQIPGLSFTSRHNGALVVYPRRRGAGQVVNAGMGVYPADEARAVKTCARGAPAPHIGIAQVFFRLGNQGGKIRVGQGLSRYLVGRAGVGIHTHTRARTL